MRECAPVLACLIGGPQDGEQMLMAPAPGVGPPQHLAYYAKRRPEDDEPFQVLVLDVYEAWPPMPVWPDADGSGAAVRLEYHWAGVRYLTKRRSEIAAEAPHPGCRGGPLHGDAPPPEAHERA